MNVFRCGSFPGRYQARCYQREFGTEAWAVSERGKM